MHGQIREDPTVSRNVSDPQPGNAEWRKPDDLPAPERKEAGLDDVRVHDLRHSYTSRALALGESLTVIGRLLGHNKVETTAKYAHLVRDAEKAAAARTGDSIGAQLMPAGVEAA